MADTFTQQELYEIERCLETEEHRLSHLYHILDKNGRDVVFSPNYNQQRIFAPRWYRIIILKNRRVGSTTGFSIRAFDKSIMVPNLQTGIISDTRANASQIIDKIRYAHQSMPDLLRKYIPIKVDNSYELRFANDSVIYAGTTFRGYTLQELIVSEYGPICKKSPDKAREIQTGALEAVSKDQFITIESTAMGAYGDFYEKVMDAYERQKRGIKPSHLDYHLVFIAWWTDPECVLNPVGVNIHPRHEEYFKKLEEYARITLTPAQKAFWVKKESALGPKIFEEYPGTVEEAFQTNTDGTYYRNQFEDMRREHRIGKVPHTKGIPVDVTLDIGMHRTVMWFSQTIGRAEHIIDHYSIEGKQLPHYKLICDTKADKDGYMYGKFIFPHDIIKRDFTGTDLSIFATAQKIFGAQRCFRCVKTSIDDGIHVTQQFLSTCWFDQERCETGLEGLENYTMEWNDNLGTFLDTPRKNDGNDDHADAFRYLAVYKTLQRARGRRGDNSTSSNDSLNRILSKPQKPWRDAYC